MTRCCKCGDCREPSTEYIKSGTTLGKYDVSDIEMHQYYLTDPSIFEGRTAKIEHLSRSCMNCGYTYFTPIAALS